jgi:hypothetical protein
MSEHRGQNKMITDTQKFGLSKFEYLNHVGVNLEIRKRKFGWIGHTLKKR